jgi:type IV pilus assembly protein PilA
MNRQAPHFRRAQLASGFTLVELLIVVAMIGVLASIAFPILLRARITANEGTAVASLRTIHSAEAAYAATCGSGGYAQSLDDLARMPPASTVSYIHSPYTANGVIQSGYTAAIIPGAGSTTVLAAASTCNGSAQDAVTVFVAERHPLLVGQTGVRSFAINAEGTIYMRNDGAAIGGALAGTLIYR